ncbi:MAG: class I SAM-dependent methyltransferase [Acidimicrobiales bacterium]|nr:class I SAM-dependent methyltransferase [Acidimicrobiales bacterium]
MGLRSKLFALTYDRFMSGGEKAGLAATRSKLLAHASGDVLEVGAGTGLNLSHYPMSVRSLALTEPDPAMLRRLERSISAGAGAGGGRPGTVLRAPAEDLPFDDATFDTVVSTLVLCGVDDQPRTVREIRRVLRPGGRFLFIEHVRSDDDKLARRQDRINWFNRLTTSCDCNRPTLRTLQQGGRVVEDVVHGDLPKSPSFVRPMVVGCAVRPADVPAS